MLQIYDCETSAESVGIDDWEQWLMNEGYKELNDLEMEIDVDGRLYKFRLFETDGYYAIYHPSALIPSESTLWINIHNLFYARIICRMEMYLTIASFAQIPGVEIELIGGERK